MRVKLLTHTPDPEYLVAVAARTCHSSEVPWGKMTGEEAKGLIQKLLDLGHESPFEHITFTFAIDGISRACSHQLVRHRMASYSQRSQRYVENSPDEVVAPPSLKRNPEAWEIFNNTMQEIYKAYEELGKLVPLEDARYVLPNAATTTMVCTFNARSLFNFFKLRLCVKAQWEIRELADQMFGIVYSIAPNIFSHVGPDCKNCAEKDCWGW